MREDFPDLIAAATIIDSSMPDVWLPAVRTMLRDFSSVKAGRRTNMRLPPTDIHIRSIAVGMSMPTLDQSVPELKCSYHAPDARGPVVNEIKRILRAARFQCRRSDLDVLRISMRDETETAAARYVHACVEQVRILEVTEDFVWERVRALVKGQPVEGVSPATVSRFLTLYKALE